jgi:hypothetical protein
LQVINVDGGAKSKRPIEDLVVGVTNVDYLVKVKWAYRFDVKFETELSLLLSNLSSNLIEDVID